MVDLSSSMPKNGMLSRLEAERKLNLASISPLSNYDRISADNNLPSMNQFANYHDSRHSKTIPTKQKQLMTVQPAGVRSHIPGKKSYGLY